MAKAIPLPMGKTRIEIFRKEAMKRRPIYLIQAAGTEEWIRILKFDLDRLEEFGYCWTFTPANERGEIYVTINNS